MFTPRRQFTCRRGLNAFPASALTRYRYPENSWSFSLTEVDLFSTLVRMKCQVCARNATGVHYGVLACEGCKAFYRRGVEKKITYLCYFGNDCITKSNTRATCKACRFKKCLALGMRIHGAKLKDGQQDRQDDASKRSKRKTIENCGQRSSSQTFDSTSTQTDTLVRLEQETDEDDQTGAAPRWCFDDSINAKTAVASTRKLVNFMNRYMDILDDNRRQMSLTVQSVMHVVQVVFGDQLTQWKEAFDRAKIHGEVPYQPETTLEQMMDALRYHNIDSMQRSQKFAAMLPGTAELDSSAKRNVNASWKWLAFWLLHHSPYMTREECHVTIGNVQKYSYCRYWQEIISEWPLLVFIYKFCGEFREIGLTQTETYLLLAVVMFEPGPEVSQQSRDGKSKLELVHRHYTDVLFDTIKHRCSDSSQLTATCRKLEHFFSALKLIYRLHRHYFRSLDLSRAPFRAIKGDRVVSVLDALRWKDSQEDAQGLDNPSPLMHKQFSIRVNAVHE